MNAIVTLDSILEPSQALTPAALFGTGQIETIVSAIESQVRAEAYDVTTPEGRERIKSVAYKIARSKTTLDEIGKEHVADIKAKSAAIDKERKTLRDRLDALKDEVRKPVTDWEQAEANRVSGHENALVVIIQAPTILAGKSSAEISAVKEQLEAMAGRDWQEFGDRAVAAFAEIMPKICNMRDAALQAEADAAELAELRRLKADREEADRKAATEKAAREEAARAEEWRRQREEQAQRDLERAVEIAREEERQRAEQSRIEAEQRAEREKAAAIEAERRRQEQEARDAAAKKAAEEAAERKRQENARHRAKVRASVREAFLKHTVVDAADVDRIIETIANGLIPHVSITY